MGIRKDYWESKIEMNQAGNFYGVGTEFLSPFLLNNPFPQLTLQAPERCLLTGNCSDGRTHLAVRNEHLQPWGMSQTQKKQQHQEVDQRDHTQWFPLWVGKWRTPHRAISKNHGGTWLLLSAPGECQDPQSTVEQEWIFSDSPPQSGFLLPTCRLQLRGWSQTDCSSLLDIQVISYGISGNHLTSLRLS